MIMTIVLWALVSYWISSAFSWDFRYVAVTLGVLVGVYHLARHFGWFGVTVRTTGISGNMTEGVRKFVVGFSTLTFVMMVGTKVIGVSNNFAFTYLLGWGPRPWLYPIATTDILIWVSLFFISAGIAALTANGRWRPAGIIFGVTLVSLFIVREMPRMSTALIPTTTASMGASATSLEKAEQAIVERGVPSVVAEAAVKASLGNSKNIVTNGVLGESGSRTGELFLGTPPDKKTSGVVGSFFKRSWTWAFGEPAPPATSVSSGTPPSTPATRQVVQLPDCATPCSLDIEEIRDLYTDGEAIEILPPGWTRDKAIPYSGRGHLVLSGGNIRSGIWQFFSADPSKVVLIRAFVLR